MTILNQEVAVDSGEVFFEVTKLTTVQITATDIRMHCLFIAEEHVLMDKYVWLLRNTTSVII